MDALSMSPSVDMTERTPAESGSSTRGTINGYAADSWNVIRCSPVDTADASGIRILNETRS